MRKGKSIHALPKEAFSVIAAHYSVNWGSVKRNLRLISQQVWGMDSGYVEKLTGYSMSKRPIVSQLIDIILHSFQRMQ